MRRSLQLLAATALCAGAFVQTAAAQDVASAVYGSTRIYVGGGFQYLSLPDIKFTGKGDPSNFTVQKNSDFSNYGWSTGGGIETGLGFWGASRVTGGIKGFWSNVTGDDRSRCKASTCVVPDPAGGPPPSDLPCSRPRPTATWIIGAASSKQSSGRRTRPT